jgi:hypothetical protein
MAKIPAWFWLVMILLVIGGAVTGNYVSHKWLKI